MEGGGALFIEFARQICLTLSTHRKQGPEMIAFMAMVPMAAVSIFMETQARMHVA